MRTTLFGVRYFRQCFVWLPALALAWLATGCATPIGASRGDHGAVYRQVNQGLLVGGMCSDHTMDVLRRYGKVEAFGEEPEKVIRFLHEKVLVDDRHDLLLALAELSYSLAMERDGWREASRKAAADHYLASAVYAHFYVTSEKAQNPSMVYDRHFRYACDLYSSALACGLADGKRRISLAPARRKLSFGVLDIAVDATQTPWPLDKFDGFLAADDFMVRGLGSRSRVSGIGTPVIAVVSANPETKLTSAVPLTVVLRVQGTVRDLAAGQCRSTLEVFSPQTMKAAHVGPAEVPLEVDYSAPLAYNLNQPELWRMGRWNFMGIHINKTGVIYQGQPYLPGKIPVLFVHGTASSYVTWAETWNTLQDDDYFRQHY